MVAKKPPSIPSTEQARKRLTVAQLKTILKSVHLSVDGLKADLLKRLETHVSNDDDDDDDDSKKTTKTTKTTTKTSKKRGRSAEKEKEEEDNDDGKEEEEEEEEEDKGALNAAAGEKRNDDDAKKASELGEIDDEEAKDSKMAKEPTTKKAKVNDDADGKEKTGEECRKLEDYGGQTARATRADWSVRAPVRETFGNSVRKLPGGCRRETREARV